MSTLPESFREPPGWRKQFLRTMGERVDIYVPTHELADELVVRCNDAGLTAAIIKGRLHEDVQCVKADVIGRLIDKGVRAVGKHVCCANVQGEITFCSEYHRCPYPEQFKGLDDFRAVIRPHACMTAPPSLVESLASRREVGSVVIDENPLGCLMDFGVYTRADFLAAESAAGAIVMELYELIVAGRNPADVWTLASGGGEYGSLKDALRYLKDEKRAPGVSPGMSANDSLIELGLWEPTRRPIEPLQLVANALSAEAPVVNGVWLDNDGASVRYARLIRPWLHADKVLLLDGTAVEQTVKAMFPGMEVDTIGVATHSHVVQVADKTYSKSSLAKGAAYTQDQGSFRAVLKARFGDRLGVVTGKEHEEGIEDVATAHFNALRGVDRLKGMDVGLLVSRVQPRAIDVEQAARALFPHDPMTLGVEYERRACGYHRRDGVDMGVLDWYHPDERCNAVLYQMREAEMAQGLGRFRLVHRDSDLPLFLLNNLPLDITVDGVVSHNQLFGPGNKLVVGLEQSWYVMPLVPEMMVALRRNGDGDRVWSSETAAKRWAGSLLKMLIRERGPSGGNSLDLIRIWDPPHGVGNAISENGSDGSHSPTYIVGEWDPSDSGESEDDAAARPPLILYRVFPFRMAKRHARQKDRLLPVLVTCLADANQVLVHLHMQLAVHFPEDTLEALYAPVDCPLDWLGSVEVL